MILKGECSRCRKNKTLIYEFRDIVNDQTFYFCSVKCLVEFLELIFVIRQIRGGEI